MTIFLGGNIMISNSEIRAKARDILGGSKLFSGSWLYPVLVILIVGVLNAAVAATYVGPIIVYGLLMVACARYFMNRVRGVIEPRNLESAIDGLRDNFLGSMLTGILYTVFISLGTLIFFIPGIIFSHSFAMAFYVINDHPEMTAMQALKESHRLMKGNRMQFFLLNLSFFGWAILGSLCFGIGTFWVSAYMETAHAVFYEELLSRDSGYTA